MTETVKRVRVADMKPLVDVFKLYGFLFTLTGNLKRGAYEGFLIDRPGGPSWYFFGHYDYEIDYGAIAVRYKLLFARRA